MNRWVRKLQPEWVLRLGLGAMYLYSGADLIVNPVHWYGYAPRWFLELVHLVVSTDAYLAIQGIGELAIALLLLAWFLPRWGLRVGATLATTELFLILVLVGIDPITFRDLGLLGGAVALTALAFRGDTA